MRLAYKLFISYLLVIVVGALVISITTAYTAPINFSSHMQNMQHQGGMMMQPDNRQSMMLVIDENVEEQVQASVNRSLLLSSLAALVVAGLLSWYVSQRITQPIRQMVSASQRIAAGHYDESLVTMSTDELGELTHSFNQMADTLAETETMRQQLIADISHELKTPLASIKGYMEGLQDGVIAPTNETFQAVHREAARLQRLVYDLQELSRTEAGAVSIDLQPVNLRELAAEVLEWIRPQFIEKSVNLSVQPLDNLPPMQADADRLRQVLLNVLGNALQYTPTGGSVTVATSATNERVHITIQDTGVGLAPDDTVRIFQRFYRVDKSRARDSGGSGIGLTVAHHLVEAMQGHIWAESAGPNQGSTFHIELKRAD